MVDTDILFSLSLHFLHFLPTFSHYITEASRLEEYYCFLLSISHYQPDTDCRRYAFGHQPFLFRGWPDTDIIDTTDC